MSGTPPVRSRNLLLLDGDLRSTNGLARLLREDGFSVEVLCDGASAISRLSREPLPDTLVTEIIVPITDGVAVARFATEKRPDMRVIVVTRYPNLLGASSFGDACPAVLSKPLDYAQLLELLEGTLAPAIARPGALLPGAGEC